MAYDPAQGSKQQLPVQDAAWLAVAICSANLVGAPHRQRHVNSLSLRQASTPAQQPLPGHFLSAPHRETPPHTSPGASLQVGLLRVEAAAPPALPAGNPVVDAAGDALKPLDWQHLLGRGARCSGAGCRQGRGSEAAGQCGTRGRGGQPAAGGGAGWLGGRQLGLGRRPLGHLGLGWRLVKGRDARRDAGPVLAAAGELGLGWSAVEAGDWLGLALGGRAGALLARRERGRVEHLACGFKHLQAAVVGDGGCEGIRGAVAGSGAAQPARPAAHKLGAADAAAAGACSGGPGSCLHPPA